MHNYQYVYHCLVYLSKLKISKNIRLHRILSFHSGTTDVSILLDYQAIPLGNPFPTIQNNVVVSKRREPITQVICTIT